MTDSDGARIRIAGIDDLPELQTIACATYREHFAHCWTEAGLQAFLDRDFSTQALQTALRDTGQCWLLMSDASGGAVGYAKVNWARSEHVSGASGAELQKIYFRADAVGRGYGTALLARIVREALQHGEPAVWLNVLKTNEAARRFYAAHGFAIAGELPYRTDAGDEAGMWTMIRML